MDKAQKKHLKELKRKKKLFARMPDQDAFPWKLAIKFHQSKRSEMSDFQKIAYDNFDIKKALRTLNQAGKLKYVKQLHKPENGLTLCDLLFQQLYEQKSIIAPYLMPFMSYGYDHYSNTLSIEAEIFTPLTLQDKELGNMYYFHFNPEYEGKKLHMLYTAHALDRITQRCNMKPNELDLHFWSWILRTCWQTDYRFEKIDDALYFIRTFKQSGFSLYFPLKVQEGYIIAKTALIPGMNPCPSMKGDFDKCLLAVKQEFARDMINKAYNENELRKKRVDTLEKEYPSKESSPVPASETPILKSVLDDLFVKEEKPKIATSSIVPNFSKLFPVTLKDIYYERN